MTLTDRHRTSTWSSWLAGNASPDPSTFSVAQTRSAMQLMHVLAMKPATLTQGFEQLWRHPPVRAEIGELLTLTDAARDASTSPMVGLDEVPLLVHARYTRAEVFAAIGISEIHKPKEHREGVYFAPHSRIQLLFVTLNKDEARFSSNVQYRDHALSSSLFDGESPNNWRQDGTAMRRCIGRGPEASKHRLLFVREKSVGGVEGTFRCFGQADLHDKLKGERPVGLVWKLRQALPEVIFESASLLTTG